MQQKQRHKKLKLPPELAQHDSPKLREILGGINMRESYDFLEIDLPDQTHWLHKFYNYMTGDIPESTNLVQWILYYDFLLLTNLGNGRFCECFVLSPYYVREKLLNMYKKAVFNAHMFTQETSRIRDPDLWTGRAYPGRSTKGLIQLEEILGVTYANYPKDNPRSGMLLFEIPERKLMVKRDPATDQYYSPEEILTKEREEYYRAQGLLEHSSYEKDSSGIESPDAGRGDEAAKAENAESQSERRVSFPSVEKTYVERTEDFPIVERNNPAERIPAAYAVDDTPSKKVKLPTDTDKVYVGSGHTCGFLGQGGSGYVVKILNEELNVFRIVKFLLDIDNSSLDSAQKEIVKQRFLQEGRIQARLQHPHITAVHGYGNWNGYDYLEMEFVDGPDLNRMIGMFRKIPDHVTTSMMLQISSALYYAHNEIYMHYGQSYYGIVHRDLKPSNIMLDETRGSSKVLDFGLSRPVTLHTQTSKANFKGTLPYASPEQVEGQKLDIRTDIYSFCLVLYEMLTGQKAFPQEDLHSLLSARLANSFKPVESHGVKLNKTLKHIVKKGLNTDPDKRFESFGEIRDLLNDAHRCATRELPEAVLRDVLQQNKHRGWGPEYKPGKASFFSRFFGR